MLYNYVNRHIKMHATQGEWMEDIYKPVLINHWSKAGAINHLVFVLEMHRDAGTTVSQSDWHRWRWQDPRNENRTTISSAKRDLKIGHPGLVLDDTFIDRNIKELMGLERKIEFISGHVGFEGSIVYYGFKHQQRDLEIQFRFGSQQQHIPNIHSDK